MADISILTKYMPLINVGSITNMLVNLFIIVITIGIMGYVMFKVLRFNVPVEIWTFEPSFQVRSDKGRFSKRDGVSKLILMKNKKAQIDNFTRFPIIKGKRTKDKIYLVEENGAYRGLAIEKNKHFFNASGEFVNPSDVFLVDDKNGWLPLTDADLYGRDGQPIYLYTMPALAPANNDSQNAFSLEALEKINKYHIPTWYEKLQYAGIIVVGIIAGLIIYIMNKAGT